MSELEISKGTKVSLNVGLIIAAVLFTAGLTADQVIDNTRNIDTNGIAISYLQEDTQEIKQQAKQNEALLRELLQRVPKQ